MHFSKQSHWAAVTILLAMIMLTSCAIGTNQPPRPNGIALAPDGSVYAMALGNHRVVHLSSEGRLLDAFGKLGTEPANIYEGWGTALDPSGNVVLCHRLRDEAAGIDRESVKVFTPQGRLVREIIAPDNGSPEGCLSVRVDSQGRIFMVNNSTNRVRILDSQGELLSTLWGTTGSGPGEFLGLRDIAIDGERGLLYASDSGNSRIQQFSLETAPTGEITARHRLTFGSYGRGPGKLAYPQYIAVDEATGHLAVGDMANRRIQIFDSNGHPLREFAAPGVEDWQVMGLAFGPDGAVFAADALNGVVWVFEPDGRLRQKMEVPS